MKINFKKACSCQFYVDINANDANGCYPLCSMLTYVLDSEISPQNNVVKISINFLRRSNWRRKTPGKVDSWTLSSFRLFNQKTFKI